MELFEEEKYSECIAKLVNEPVSTEKTLTIAKCLHKLEKFETSLYYHMKVIDYYDSVPDNLDIFEENISYFINCIIKNNNFGLAYKYSVKFLNIFPNSAFLYEKAIFSCQDNIVLGYSLLTECLEKKLLSSIKVINWEKYAEYSKNTGNDIMYYELYKVYEYKKYVYFQTCIGNCEFILEKSIYLKLCYDKKFDEYEKLLLANNDYINLALFYSNYLKEHEKAILFASSGEDLLSKLLLLFLKKDYKKFMEYLSDNYSSIVYNKTLMIYDCTNISVQTIRSYFYPHGYPPNKRRKLPYLSNIITIKFMKGIVKTKLRKYSSAIEDFEDTFKYNENSKIYLAYCMYKDGDFFNRHVKYLEDLPDSSVTKKMLITFYRITKQKDKYNVHLKEYLTQSVNNFSAYFGITGNKIDFFARNKYGVLPLISLLYCTVETPDKDLLNSINFDMIKKNNILCPLLTFINSELDTEYNTISDILYNEQMNKFVINYLNEKN